MLLQRFIIGFSGHRQNLDVVAVSQAIERILKDLKARAARSGGCVEVYASVAEGSDTLFVEAARQQDLGVHLLLPLREEEFAKDFTSPAAWDRSARQIQSAKQRPGRDSVHSVDGEASRPECYFDQAITMLDAVDVLVTVWDGAPERGIGGTGQVVAQARRMKIPTISIDPRTGVVTTEGDLERAFSPDTVICELNHLSHRAAGTPTSASTANELQENLDAIAIHEARHFRPSLVRIILLHGFAALLAAAVTFNFEGSAGTEHWWTKSKWIFTAVELLLVLSALWMARRLHKKHIQQRWIDSRFACEEIRALRACVPLVDPLHPIISRHDPKWRRFSLSAGLLVLKDQATANPLALRDQYLATRLSDSHADGQIRHYQTMRPSALWWWNFTGFISNWSATLAPVFVLLSLLNKLSKHMPSGHGWHLDKNPYTWALVVFLPIALPLIAGIASSLRHALDAGRRKEKYPQTVDQLCNIKRSLEGLVTPTTIRNAVTRSEELLLNERLEWKLAMKNTGH